MPQYTPSAWIPNWVPEASVSLTETARFASVSTASSSVITASTATGTGSSLSLSHLVSMYRNSFVRPDLVYDRWDKPLAPHQNEPVNNVWAEQRVASPHYSSLYREKMQAALEGPEFEVQLASSKKHGLRSVMIPVIADEGLPSLLSGDLKTLMHYSSAGMGVLLGPVLREHCCLYLNRHSARLWSMDRACNVYLNGSPRAKPDGWRTHGFPSPRLEEILLPIWGSGPPELAFLDVRAAIAEEAMRQLDRRT